MSKPLCRHCCDRRVCRPRGLCWGCFYTPAVRARYPAAVRVGAGLPGGARPLPAEPTATAPGSEARIAVLSGRAARGESLWHPEDAVIGHATAAGLDPRRPRRVLMDG